MKLRRLRITQFKRFREPLQIDGFADGLNLFAAPNEAGKSTVAEALRAAFFERHRSGSVEHLRPWGDGSAAPTVEVDFELNGRLHRLTKVFLGKKRCTLLIDGQPPLDGAAAEDHLAGLLGFRFAGKGASAAEHQGIPGLLWIRQGSSHVLHEPVAHAADHLRQVLGESLGDLASSAGDALLRSVEAQRNELLTPASGNPRGEHAAALQRRAELAATLDALTRDIVAYQGSVDRLAQLRREHQRDAQQRPWVALRLQQQAAVARLEAAQGLAARLAAEQATLGQWRAQTAALRSELEAFARDDAAVAARRQALQLAATAEATALAEAEAWARRHREAQAAESQARQQLERVRAVAARAELARSAADLDTQCTGLAATLARAQDERTRWLRLQAEAEAGAIAPAELKRLKHLTDSLRDVNVRLEAVATTLEIDLLDGQCLQLGDDTLTGHSRHTVASRTEIGIAGVGRIVVQPGGADIHALAQQRDSLATELATLLQQLRAANPAAADERARLASQRQQEARASQKVLEALAPQSVDTLQAELAGRSARAAELRAALAALPNAQPGDDGLPDRAAAQAAAERSAGALDAAADALNAARVALGKAQGSHATARQELAAAEATVADAQRALRIAAARQTLTDALAQEAGAQQRAEAIGLQLQQVNLPLLQQDVERLARSAQQAEEAHERRHQEITRLEVQLETQGALGLEEQRAETGRELEAASRRATELARRAAALDHLLNLLRDKRAALARRLRAPLQRHLDHYLAILFPGAQIAVADDLSPGAITRDGPCGPERGDFGELSVGTQEQMGIVARLAYADLLQQAGRPTLLILDDALVHTDEYRLQQMKRVLYDAAARHQVLVFTCHPEAWRGLGVEARGLG
jgi:AAA domain